MLKDQLRVVEFKTQYRVGKDPVDWVMLAPAGAAFEKTRTWHRIKDLTPPADAEERFKESESYQAMLGRWALIGPAYEAWRSGNDVPEGGTPLAAWSGVTPEQAAFLKKVGVRTVEDVAAMGEMAVKELRWPGSQKLPKQAKSWLEGENVAAKDAQIAEMAERMAAMEAMLEEQSKKRGPGRPPKVEAA